MRTSIARLLFILSTIAFALLSAPVVHADDTKPNILYIIADDLGWRANLIEESHKK